MQVKLLTNVPAYGAVAGDVIDVPPSFAKRWESQGLAEFIDEAAESVKEEPEVAQEPKADEAEGAEDEAPEDEVDEDEDPVEKEAKGLKKFLKRGGEEAESAEEAEVVEERG